MSGRTMDWISNVTIMVGFGLLLVGVYLGLGLAFALGLAGVILILAGVLLGISAYSQRQQERRP